MDLDLSTAAKWSSRSHVAPTLLHSVACSTAMGVSVELPWPPAVCLVSVTFPGKARQGLFVAFRYKKSAAQQNASAVFGMAECLQKSGDDLKAFKWSSHSRCTLTLLHACGQGGREGGAASASALSIYLSTGRVG